MSRPITGTLKCIVLYGPTSSYGIQIISESAIDDVQIQGDDDYNNAIVILNTSAEKYLNTQYATSARSVGSNPTSPYSENGSTTYYNRYTMKIGDSNYITDSNQMSKLEISSTNTAYWLASRENVGFTSGDSFRLRSSKGNIECFFITPSGGSDWYQNTLSIRPVFTLKNNLRITSGDGSKDNPYNLGI